MRLFRPKTKLTLTLRTSRWAPARCTAALSSFGTTGAVISAGFSQYRTRNPTTGVDRVVSLSSLGVPSFYATNCDSVTLMAWVNDFNGGSSAQPLFNIYYLG
jgi:hypothetical protein